MELRPYQIEVKNKVFEAFNKHRRVMLQLPTGAGKTHLFTSIAKDFVDNGYCVWVLVHRKELIDQTINKAQKYGLQISVIQADYQFSQFSNFHIASVQTAIRRLEKIPANAKPKLIICDEAHHSLANSYKSIYKEYPEAQILGVTATPIRTNGEGFKDLFDIMVKGLSVKELIEQGYLVQPKIFANAIPFNLGSVKVTAGDYNEKDLHRAYEENCTYGDLVKNWKERAFNKLTIVFAINIEHSKKIVETYQNAGIKAEHVDGETPKEQRNAILNRFRNGVTKVVSNVGIITEGFDVPACECIQLVRPTKSLSLYLQMVGRGLRPASEKEHAIILDHSNSVYVHGFPEQDRDWTLNGITPKKNQSLLYRDRETGKQYEAKDLPKHVTEIELVELDYDTIRLATMDQFLKTAKERDYKMGYAWFKFTEKYKNPTRFEIERFQKLAGYTPNWCKHQYQYYGI